MSYPIPLPYSTVQLQAPFVQVSPGSFPGSLPVVVNQNLMQFLPLIGTACIDVVQNRAQENPLRVFLYNQMRDNVFNNQSFYELVKLTAIYADMCLQRGIFTNPTDAIYDSANKMTEMVCAENMRNVNGLASVLDPLFVNKVQNTLIKAQNVRQELGNFLNGISGFNQPQYPQQNNHFPQAVYPSVMPPPPYQRSFPQQQQPQQNNIYGNNLNSQPVFSNNNQNSFTRPNQQPSIGSSFLVKDKVEEPLPIKIETIVPPPPVATVVPALADKFGDKTEWVPSKEYPFNLAFDPNRQELCYLVEPGKPTIPFTKELTPEKLMERYKHFKSITVPVTTQTLVESEKEANAIRSEKFARNINGDCISNKQIEVDIMIAGLPESTENVELLTEKEKNVIGVGDQEIWRDCDLMLLAKKKENVQNIAYSSCAYVNDPLVTLSSPKPLADKLLSCEDLFTAFNILKTAKAAAIRSDNPIDELTIVNYFNMRLTERINRFTQNQLCLAINIDSFITEGVELIDYIEKKFGDKFSDPLRLSQKKIIEDCCTYATDGYEKSLTGLYLNSDMPFRPNVTFFYSLDYFVSLHCFSIDLRFEIPDDKCSVAIFENNVPILYKLANHIYKEADTYSYTFNRCLIRTLDRKIYMLNRSVIDKDTYLVNVVK